MPCRRLLPDAGLRCDFLEYLNLDAALEDLAADQGDGEWPHVRQRHAAPRTLLRRMAWLAAAAALLLTVTLGGRWLARGVRGPDRVAVQPVERPIEKPVPSPRDERPVRRMEMLASGWQIEPIGDTEYRVLGDGRVRLQHGDLMVQSAVPPRRWSATP